MVLSWCQRNCDAVAKTTSYFKWTSACSSNLRTSDSWIFGIIEQILTHKSERLTSSTFAAINKDVAERRSICSDNSGFLKRLKSNILIARQIVSSHSFKSFPILTIRKVAGSRILKSISDKLICLRNSMRRKTSRLHISVPVEAFRAPSELFVIGFSFGKVSD
ncbi:hypothetical protein TRFO_40961 [Tritrichomonas foetus]|uniref:Uncharacterized protein n=1 Tax=Tritrichomonas foetus TaxID=1144522 RepID=A0A1J4IZC1_9EUKA|nr:hypothetical protein TRFO_40961 [Tritrichomonas foetus]|eukprot:OHS92704.1 hypothetical protein TRFO_40961 [Tritrichomonas foetus]